MRGRPSCCCRRPLPLLLTLLLLWLLQGVGEALLMTKDILGHMAGTMDEAVEAWQAAHGGNAAAAAAAAGSRQQQQQQPAAMDEDR